MIPEDRLQTFIHSMEEDLPTELAALERAAKADRIPIIRKDTQSFLRFLLSVKKPERILEIGTAVGFSALLMAAYSKARIDTIENYEKRIPVAKENFARWDRGRRITLYEGDAAKILPELSGPYDFIFMDAAKGQYPVFWELIRPMVSPGGIVVTDNVLQDGNIIESRFAVERMDRTIHKRMREFLYDVSRDSDFVSDILPIGDGLSVLVKKGE